MIKNNVKISTHLIQIEIIKNRLNFINPKNNKQVALKKINVAKRSNTRLLKAPQCTPKGLLPELKLILKAETI